MKISKAIVIFLIIVVFVLAAGFIWLSQTKLMPPQQKVDQAIQDDSIAR